MDIQQVVSTLKPCSSGLRFRQGVIVSVQSDSTATITIAGSTTEVSGVKVLASCCPVPGAACWIAVDGRDLFVFGLLAPVGPASVRIRQAAAQTLSHATTTTLQWGSTPAELVDNAGMYVPGTSLTDLVVRVPGLYLCTLTVCFVANSTGYRQIGISNGAATQAAERRDANVGVVTISSLSSAFVADVADVIKASALQSSGGDLDTVASAGYGVLTATWLGPAG